MDRAHFSGKLFNVKFFLNAGIFRNAEILEVTQFAWFRNLTKRKLFREISNVT